jgi:hypothetical protein
MGHRHKILVKDAEERRDMVVRRGIRVWYEASSILMLLLLLLLMRMRMKKMGRTMRRMMVMVILHG